MRHSVAAAIRRAERQDAKEARKGRARADLRVVLEWQSNYKNINLSVEGWRRGR